MTHVLLGAAGLLALAGSALTATALRHGTKCSAQPEPEPTDPTREAAETSGLIPRPAGPSPTERQEDLTW